MFCLRSIYMWRSSTVGRALQTLYLVLSATSDVFVCKANALSFICLNVHTPSIKVRAYSILHLAAGSQQSNEMALLPMSIRSSAFTCLAHSHTQTQCMLFATGTYHSVSNIYEVRRARSLPKRTKETSIQTFQTNFKVNEFQFRGEIQSE